MGPNSAYCRRTAPPEPKETYDEVVDCETLALM